MRLRFDPDQPHQRAAIDAVLELLRGQPRVTLSRALAEGRAHGVVANHLALPPTRLVQRVHERQRAAGLPPSPRVLDEHGVPQVSVEMETGTGKTYVYLRTLLELALRHGLRKAVVVVPSVAVREGVLHTLRATAEHFAALYPGLRHRGFAYDGARPSRLRAFVRSSEIELMVLTLDAFNKARNRLRQPHDGFGGRAPLELLRAVRPVVVLDEPQRMESPRSRAAIADLAPLWVLRYGATHRRPHGLVHRLTPRAAYEQGLVKRVEVAAPAAGLCDRVARIEAQVRATVALHLRRQTELLPRGIKVLSLLFVERVDDWVADDGVVRAAFTRSFEALRAEHPWCADRTAAQVSAAYFAVRHRGGRARAIDSRTGRSAADEQAHALIMRDKERLLSLGEPVCFVVSHSALREGWDNPNVFQICTLAPARGLVRKRQEVGRGVRLCVDQHGRRVRDPAVDVLTVVANDSYEDYVAGLQTEDAAVVDEPDAAPLPRLAGQGSGRPRAGVAGSLPAWRSIDGQRLRARAVAAARRWGGDSDTDTDASASATGEPDGDPGVDPITAVTERLLHRHPPCLVSRRTMQAVLHALPEPLGAWLRIERAVAAIVEALDEPDS